MKDVAKLLLGKLVRSLPHRVQVVLLEHLRGSLGPWPVMVRVATECGVVSLKVTGEYGVIQSSGRDLDILGRYSQTGIWAQRINDLLRSFFDGRAGRYIDIGANIGLTTIPVAQNPRVRCLAIEPEPTNFTNLAVNVPTNCPHGNVEQRQVAVFTRREKLRFEMSPYNLGDHRLRLRDEIGQWGEEKWSTIEVEAAPLDEIVASGQGPLAVKIDVQGAEPFVFEGGSRTLADADLIIAEWSPYWMARMGSEPRRVTDFLSTHFERISIAEAEDGGIPAPESAVTGAARLLEMAHQYRSDPRWYVDLIAAR